MYSKAEKQEYQQKLRELLKPGDTVYTDCTHVSRSGRSRNIRVLIIRDNQPRYLSYWVARACGLPMDKGGDAVKVGGCGMDMGFHLAYILGATLWPNGTDKPHGMRNGNPDSDGGYALNQRWL